VYNRPIKIVAAILLIGIAFLGSMLIIQRQNLITKVGTESDKYVGEYYNEYIQWENRMINENPEYEDIKILIDISEKSLYLINGSQLLKRYPVATGKQETPSPLGSWKISNKAKWGGGFGTRWMGMNVPWGKFGIHGTNKPNSIGYNASAGCIRMRNSDVEDLYKHVKHGTPVAIVNGAMGPFGYGIRTIKPGDMGADVMEIQRRLRAFGYYNTDYLDGKYGPYMEQALYAFQRENNIPQTPHIDWQTYKALGVIMME
jgi:hypothetical protein